MAPTTDTSAWASVAPGIDRLDTETITLFRFAPGAFSWEFAHADQPSPVSSWAATLPDAVAVINGVYFKPDFTPAGLFIDNGTRIGSTAFDEDRSGILEFAPTLAIVDTATEEADKTAMTEAAQSYPFLIKDGQPAVATDSGALARRSFFGLDKQGNAYLGIVPDTEMSLYALAQTLSTLQTDWTNVLNLDGGPSSGLVVNAGDESESIDSFVGVPNVIVARRLQ